jgi:hypothetical protein
MPYHTILRNAVQVANSNWHNSATSFSPTITWEDEDGRQATIGYSDRQVVEGWPDERVVLIKPVDGSAADFGPIDCLHPMGVH